MAFRNILYIRYINKFQIKETHRSSQFPIPILILLLSFDVLFSYLFNFAFVSAQSFTAFRTTHTHTHIHRPHSYENDNGNRDVILNIFQWVDWNMAMRIALLGLCNRMRVCVWRMSMRKGKRSKKQKSDWKKVENGKLPKVLYANKPIWYIKSFSRVFLWPSMLIDAMNWHIKYTYSTHTWNYDSKLYLESIYLCFAKRYEQKKNNDPNGNQHSIRVFTVW